MPYRSLTVVLALLAGLVLLPGQRRAEAAKASGWGTIKGQVVLQGPIPAPKKINVTKDQKHCLSRGALLSQELVVNAKNKGMRWVFVWLAPDPSGDVEKLPIHPSLKKIKEKDRQVVLDQPCCQFIPHCFAVREGQELVVKNSAPVSHNINWASDPLVNKPFNILLPPGSSKTVSGLKSQVRFIPVSCNIHPWMSAWARVFDHPYFAITDENGNFEIKKAPAGTWRLIVWQESIGWLGAAKGKNGQPVVIKAGAVTELGKLSMKPD